jgi:hypothetical protein
VARALAHAEVLPGELHDVPELSRAWKEAVDPAAVEFGDAREVSEILEVQQFAAHVVL